MSIRPLEKKESGSAHFACPLTPIPETEPPVEDLCSGVYIVVSIHETPIEDPKDITNSPCLEKSETTDNLQQDTKSDVTNFKNIPDSVDPKNAVSKEIALRSTVPVCDVATNVSNEKQSTGPNCNVTKDISHKKQRTGPKCNVTKNISKEENSEETSKGGTQISVLSAKQNVFKPSRVQDAARQQAYMPSTAPLKVSRIIPSVEHVKPQENASFRIPPVGPPMSSRVKDLLKDIVQHGHINLPVALLYVQKPDEKVLSEHSPVYESVVPEEEKRATPKYKCTICNICFVRKAYLVKHVIGKHSAQNCCLKCVKIFNTDKKYKEHMLNFHPRFSCEICGVVFSNKYELKCHTDTYRDPKDKQFKCMFANCSFAHCYFPYFEYHINKHRKKNPFCCGKCQKQFYSRHTINRHLKTCISKCPKCNREFSDGSMIYSHMETCHVDKIFACPDCDETYKWRASLSRHIALNH